MLAALMENKECQLVPEDLASKALGAKEERKKKKKVQGSIQGNKVQSSSRKEGTLLHNGFAV